MSEKGQAFDHCHPFLLDRRFSAEIDALEFENVKLRDLKSYRALAKKKSQFEYGNYTRAAASVYIHPPLFTRASSFQLPIIDNF